MHPLPEENLDISSVRSQKGVPVPWNTFKILRDWNPEYRREEDGGTQQELRWQRQGQISSFEVLTWENGLPRLEGGTYRMGTATSI